MCVGLELGLSDIKRKYNFFLSYGYITTHEIQEYDGYYKYNIIEYGTIILGQDW